MLKIKLKQEEFEYLCKVPFVDEELKKIIFCPERIDDVFFIKGSLDEIDRLRDVCGEQLQIIGFDKNYELTNEGEILESLIDKFFVG